MAKNKVFISKDDEYFWGQGTHYEIYNKLGSHPSTENGKSGFFFAVWAPNAASVHVVGDFNGWSDTMHPMHRQGEIGIFTLFIPGLGEGELYKYLITTPSGEKIYKADPFANWAELRPGTASKTVDLDNFKWSDSKWFDHYNELELAKKPEKLFEEPLAIYECQIGSWMKHPDGTEDGFYNYREFADRIVDYLKEMKYTHIELIGIAEHPFDGSWGYQVTGYYAPTSRYGSPIDFKYLINKLHRNGIGVILDWVPAHFCPDEHGLARFDGQCIYEHPDPRKGEHPDWGTKIFNFEKNEVKNFLIANALYWIREFHVDGLRVDAVASMLYLDYGKKEGQWVRNKNGGNENLDAIAFFRHLNSVVRGTYPQILMIAEESTAWPNISGPIGGDGLGFTYKWNMGWMHDFCEYMKLDPVMRGGAHHMMTFAMSYNDAERYILPLSHDEVVHLKCSMVEKMPGYKVDKFANLRVGYTFMFGHAGKKLLFMGQDFGQEREWSEARELDWYLLDMDLNRGMREYTKELLEIYRKYPAMYKHDHGFAGFTWINADDADRSVYSFYRKDGTGKNNVLFVLNFTPMEWKGYKTGVPFGGEYKHILDSAETRFGGFGTGIPAKIKAVRENCDYLDYSLTMDLPPYAAEVFVFDDMPAEKEKKSAAKKPAAKKPASGRAGTRKKA
ncbi:MAG: 1,4-alpha-glucan branching protein GlgB [Lachnospiraceae bacterium]|nr:1,4-alpha-glucan branching protein GlgB [Lachnospiraceae bacterium]